MPAKLIVSLVCTNYSTNHEINVRSIKISTYSHLANSPWNKSLNCIFPTEYYVIPKSLKFSHWPSKYSPPHHISSLNYAMNLVRLLSPDSPILFWLQNNSPSHHLTVKRTPATLLSQAGIVRAILHALAANWPRQSFSTLEESRPLPKVRLMVETTTVHLKLDINHQRNHLWINEIGTGYQQPQTGEALTNSGWNSGSDQWWLQVLHMCFFMLQPQACYMFPRQKQHQAGLRMFQQKTSCDEDVTPRVSTSETLLTFIHMGWLLGSWSTGNSIPSAWPKNDIMMWSFHHKEKVMCCHVMKIN